MENTKVGKEIPKDIHATTVDPVLPNDLKDFVNNLSKEETKKEGEKTFKEGLANNSDTK